MLKWLGRLTWWVVLVFVFVLGLGAGVTLEYNSLERYRFMTVDGELYRVNTRGQTQRCDGTIWRAVREMQ